MNKQILSMLATGAVLLGTLAPAVLADTSFTVSGNGADSTSNVTSTSTNANSVVQDNTARVTNNVSSSSTTGGNNADENTGGNVTVDTGNAVNATDVSTRANSNFADLGNCTSCNTGGTSVALSGNGFNSANSATVNANNNSSLFQTNDANVNNNVRSNAQTGDNNANRNTGGDVLVLTGHAANDTSVQTAVNANMANMGGGLSGSGLGSDIRILGNGADSNNSIALTGGNSTTVVQDNNARVNNRVKSNANSGNNNADENTGGNVTVDTGNALNTTDVRTMANFNSADLGSCGCTTGGDIFGKISGNGFNSRNRLAVTNADTMSVFQGGQEGNLADITNNVNANGRTGGNSAGRNTAALGTFAIDPVTVVTGHSKSDTAVSNMANMNVLGSPMQLPGGLNVGFTFDLNGLMNMLHF